MTDLPQGYPQKLWTGPDSFGAAADYPGAARSHLKYRRQLTPREAGPGEAHRRPAERTPDSRNTARRGPGPVVEAPAGNGSPIQTADVQLDEPVIPRLLGPALSLGPGKCRRP